ncbi:MAG: RDD family protein [Dehalococcoidia bacterium]|nr:RDD family protein [Dehalococcoidia bacterium]
MRPSTATPTDRVYAGFWARAIGHIIDGVLISVVSAILGQNDQARQLISNVVFVAYFWFFWARGQTLGHMLVGVRLVDSEGNRPGAGRALGRLLASFLSLLSLGLGYVWAAWHPEKRTWHDSLSGTWAVEAKGGVRVAAPPPAVIAAVQDPAVAGRKQPDRTLMSSAIQLTQLGRHEEAVAAFEEMVRMLGGGAPPIIRVMLDALAGDPLRHGVTARIGAIDFQNDLGPLAVFFLLSQRHLGIDGGPAAYRDDLLRATVFQLVTGSASGAIRLTLIDPVGAGQGLSAFLSLPPAIRGERVLTSSNEIERELETLARECEDVLQTRLGARFSTIHEYNAANPALAQPHRLVAILRLPAGGWTERALDLLARLARNGPRAGFHVVATLDPAAPMPRDMKLADAFRPWGRLEVNEVGVVHLPGALLGDFPLVPSKIPDAATVESALDGVRAAFGRPRALDSSDVLVPIDWAASTADGLSVPIGMALEGESTSFHLGTGTIHNALVGGMVGSGKTNLLLLLIDQLASRYSPDELGLYLLDLKEGVSFVDYLALPHARAVTQATDREFALSVLRDLRAQIEARGSRFREAGASQYTEFRARGGTMPRLLLVVDEFQVLVSDEDQLGREAGAILEDLVRRGRGFGIHVLLASQTPAGVSGYLTRVYEQMPLRVAFKSSDATSTAILGDGNVAASRLEEPGEAILNEDFGHTAANHRIRVALLPGDEHRARVTAIADRDGGAHPPPATFEGTTPASLTGNPRLQELRIGAWRPDPDTAEAFLGEPVEVKGPTAARFERFPRNNLLIAGPDELDAYGLLEAVVVSLALEQPDAAFYVLDFARTGPLSSVMAALQQRIPNQVSVAGPREAGSALGAALEDLDARLAASDATRGPRYLVVTGLQRWRELRGPDAYQQTPEATSLLRLADEGPDQGWHVIAWTDGLTAVERVLGRQGTSRFDLRASLRVPEADSNSLFDSPVASRLADNRALFRHEEWALGRTEKFKPYRLLGAAGLNDLLPAEGDAHE